MLSFMLHAACSHVSVRRLPLCLMLPLVLTSMNCAGRPPRPSAIEPTEPDSTLDQIWKEHRERADIIDGEQFMPNQFILFSREPFHTSEEMKSIAEKLGVRLIQEIPAMGIWLMECDCHGKYSELQKKMDEAEKQPGVQGTTLNFLMDLN